MAEDAELLQAWRAGDKAAGDALMARYYPSVLRFFELRTRVAEDLTQATFVACVEGRDRIRDASGFRGYLFGTARNTLLNHISARRVPETFDDAIDPQTSMSTVVARSREQVAVLQALARVPIPMQLPLTLFYWDELSGPEIAAALGVPESTVRTRLSRARAELRRLLDQSKIQAQVRAEVERSLDSVLRSLGEPPPAPQTGLPPLGGRR